MQQAVRKDAKSVPAISTSKEYWKKDMALELIFFHKNALLIKDGIMKNK
jgi:hypothetical protein